MLPAEQHGASDDGRVAVETSPPQMVADDRDSFRRAVVLLVRDEAAPERHPDQERIEVVGAHRDRIQTNLPAGAVVDAHGDRPARGDV